MRHLHVDFNTMSMLANDHVLVCYADEIADGCRHGDLVGLMAGERVLLCGGDLQAEGILTFDPEMAPWNDGTWTALPDWSTRHDPLTDKQVDWCERVTDTRDWVMQRAKATPPSGPIP